MRPETEDQRTTDFEVYSNPESLSDRQTGVGKSSNHDSKTANDTTTTVSIGARSNTADVYKLTTSHRLPVAYLGRGPLSLSPLAILEQLVYKCCETVSTLLWFQLAECIVVETWKMV